jgi:hypothetical protein
MCGCNPRNLVGITQVTSRRLCKVFLRRLPTGKELSVADHGNKPGCYERNMATVIRYRM